VKGDKTNKRSKSPAPDSSKERGVTSISAVTLEKSEKKRLIREEKCYRYKKPGYLARNYPKKNEPEPSIIDRKLAEIELEEEPSENDNP